MRTDFLPGRIYPLSLSPLCSLLPLLPLSTLLSPSSPLSLFPLHSALSFLFYRLSTLLSPSSPLSLFPLQSAFSFLFYRLFTLLSPSSPLSLFPVHSALSFLSSIALSFLFYRTPDRSPCTSIALPPAIAVVLQIRASRTHPSILCLPLEVVRGCWDVKLDGEEWLAKRQLQKGLHESLLKRIGRLNVKKKTKPKGLEMKRRLLPQSQGAGKKNQQQCPQGTIPILRQLTNGHNTLDIPSSYSTNANAVSISEDYREFAAVRGQYVSEVLGAVGNLNIWKPEVEPNEYSASRIIVLGGTSDSQLYQDHILAGWIANGTAGCFNLDCPGFVQVSPKQVFGGSLPASAYKKIQIHIFVGIFKDEDGNWWLQFNQDPIGYWPGSLFPYLSSGANSTEWGGEILNTRPGGSRSTTQMGSGHPWFEGFRSAAYISSMRYVDRDDEKQQLQVVNVDAIVPFVTNEGCNQAAYYGNDDWMHRHLFFGGTPNNSTCS